MSRNALRRFAAAALGLALAGSLAAPAPAQGDPKAEALSWQKQASDTRKTVMDVAAELDRIGDKGNAPARGMIDDAKRWVGEGDKQTSVGDTKLGAGEYVQAKNAYSEAWNHYVRAATSGLNAKRMLTGE